MVERFQEAGVPSDTPTFSFLLPTRSNVTVLGAFLDSVFNTTRHPDAVEVVLCLDCDDEPSLNFEHPTVPCVKTVVEPGTSMGAMNNQCCEVATGEYLMLLNDDVLLRTRGWDLLVLETLNRAPDRHALIHVNDMIFGPSLCTFPMLSRQTVELVGLCPKTYRRYAIDDHLFDIFHILRCLGHDRIRYMENIVFEHLNFNLNPEEDCGRVYEPHISPEQDWALFWDLLPDRKRAALKLALDIDGDRRNESVYLERLEKVGFDKEYRKMKPLRPAEWKQETSS